MVWNMDWSRSRQKKYEHGVLTVIVTGQANNKKKLGTVSATHQNSDFGNGGIGWIPHWVPLAVSPICRALAAVTAGQIEPVPCDLQLLWFASMSPDIFLTTSWRADGSRVADQWDNDKRCRCPTTLESNIRCAEKYPNSFKSHWPTVVTYHLQGSSGTYQDNQKLLRAGFAAKT